VLYYNKGTRGPQRRLCEEVERRHEGA